MQKVKSVSEAPTNEEPSDSSFLVDGINDVGIAHRLLLILVIELLVCLEVVQRHDDDSAEHCDNHA